MNQIRQKHAVIGCWEAAGGNYIRARNMYAELDSANMVRRDSNVCPHSSKSYASIVMAQGKKLGWIS